MECLKRGTSGIPVFFYEGENILQIPKQINEMFKNNFIVPEVY
jgi:hypothetical protein